MFGDLRGVSRGLVSLKFKMSLPTVYLMDLTDTVAYFSEQIFLKL